ncbi:MAG: hypothetical protein CMI74_04020 [Candidatus Pelagibacter sp.]|nr:hypothetical protein [Candidatus Pelagibacter sp.]|tara:strand:- start:9620 stop:10624 length:1005 start_codon:yes stop_codon:yes gene_type:complete
MGFVAAAIIGGGLGAVGGYLGGREARKGQERALEAQMESFRFSKPYIQRSYDNAEDYLARSQEMGAYGGQTYAGMNPYSTLGNTYMGNMGLMGAQGAFDLSRTGQGFGQNYQTMFDEGGADRMGVARDYALANSQPLVDAAMRDDRRNLLENTMTGINLGASGSGNMNSSRAGVAEGVAMRGYGDRLADTTSMINADLMDKSLASQERQFRDRMLANEGLKGSYLTGINAMGAMGDFMTGAGRNFRNYDQGYLDDQRGRFERDRDFALDQQIKYQQGILGQADYNSPQNPVRVTASPFASAFGGAMTGSGMGMDIAKFLRGQPEPEPTNTGGGN